MLNRFRLAALVIALTLFTGGTAHADNVEEARTLGSRGVQHYNDAEYRKAYDLLVKADQLHHAPTLTLYIARSHAKLNRLVEAKTIYQALIREATQPNAPQQFVSAKRDATNELGQLAARIPTLLVVIKPGNAPGLRLSIDGAPQPVGSAIELNPGTHDVQAFADGIQPIAQQVSLAEGAAETAVLTLGSAAVGDDDDDDDDGVGDSGGSGGSLVPAIIAFGVGGAGIVLGAITGSIAASKVSDIEAQCTPTCPASLIPERDEAATLATVSTVGFIMGGIGIAAGVVLAIVQPGGSDDPATNEVATLDLVVGPQWIGLKGTF